MAQARQMTLANLFPTGPLNATEQQNRQRIRDAQVAARRDGNNYLRAHGMDALVDAVGPSAFGRGKGRKGMNELSKVILDEKRDIRRLNKAITIDGARRYADKLGNGHSADIVDLNKDGITEVVVFDVNGNPIVINGYTTRQSDWPLRQKYYEERGPKNIDMGDGRMRYKTLGEYRNEIFQPVWNVDNPLHLDDYTQPAWAAGARNQKYKVPNPPKKRNIYRMFQDVLLKQVWDHMAAQNHVTKKNYVTACAFAWNVMILSIAVIAKYGSEGYELLVTNLREGNTVEASLKDACNKMKNDATVKANIQHLVEMYYNAAVRDSRAIANLMVDALRNGNLLATGISMDVANIRHQAYADNVMEIFISGANNEFNLGLTNNNAGANTQQVFNASRFDGGGTGGFNAWGRSGIESFVQGNEFGRSQIVAQGGDMTLEELSSGPNSRPQSPRDDGQQGQPQQNLDNLLFT